MHFGFRSLGGTFAALLVLSATGCLSVVQPTPLQIASGAADPDNRYRVHPDLQKVKALVDAGHDVNGTKRPHWDGSISSSCSSRRAPMSRATPASRTLAPPGA
ncbi:MAG: hypothetical protein OEW21_18670 [Betaproteobacteria bacterium]|nr:hypothetical protein [Betaproteobacteria bacterium]